MKWYLTQQVVLTMVKKKITQCPPVTVMFKMGGNKEAQ